MRPLPLRVFGDRDFDVGFRARFAEIVIVAAGICAFLYFGKDVLVPIALAVLLTFLLAPLVRKMQQLRIPRAAAILLTVLLSFAVLFSVSSVIALQITQLMTNLPRYENNLREKVRSLRLTASVGGPIESAADLLKDLDSELKQPESTSAQQPVVEAKPIPVEIREPEMGPLKTLSSFVVPLLPPLVHSGIVLLFVIFILFQREDLRNRFIRLAGMGDLQKTTAALDDAGRRLSRLFLMQAAINVTYGVFIGFSLWLLGVPGAILWGVLTAFLRFIPYIGSILSAIFPVLIAAAVSDGWTLPLLAALLFLITEPILGHFIEPMLFGHSVGLSPAAVVVAAAFWTALWGPVGLILATPLTICLVVLGRHIESLGFLDVLFGAEPALSPAQMFYQRMLASDQLEAVEQAQEFLKEGELAAYVTDIAVPGLMLAQKDHERKSLSLHHQNEIATSFSEVLDEIYLPADQDAVEDNRILLIPARGPLNFAATVAFSAYLKASGVPHIMLPQAALMPGNADSANFKGALTACICYLVAPAEAHHDYFTKRVVSYVKGVPITGVAWSHEEGKLNLDTPAQMLAKLRHQLEVSSSEAQHVAEEHAPAAA